MKKAILLLIALVPMWAFSQFEFNNKGAGIYIQKGALLKVDGNFINDNGSSNGAVSNDGTIELKGDFENKTNASFGVHTDNTSKDRAVKFVGSGTQAIKGDMSGAGAGFYNLVIDKASATEAVEMQTSVKVGGSLVFGTTTTTTTYDPSSIFTNNNKKGLLKTYSSGNEMTLSITNGNIDAIAGYAPLAMDNGAQTGYILTQGNRGSSNGGVERMVASANGYVYPIGTEENGYNAVKLNFNQIPAGGGMVTGKFNDGTDNPRGYVGTVTPQCVGCTQAADNPGYNRYFDSNPCNGGAGQWFILEDAIIDHGYWSFAAASNNTDYKYVVETFPNSYTATGELTDTWRTVKLDAAYGDNPSGMNVDWSANIEDVTDINDLLSYSLNTGSCYGGAGVPGGEYTGFGQFALKKANSNNALPVELIYVKAEPNNNSTIDVSWATAVEINNSGFEVERSTDGVNFTKIGWVAGNNNSTTTIEYAYNDKNVTAGIVYYYRLHQVDNDGASENSQIVSASLTGGATVTVSEPMPNPARDFSRVVVNSTVSQTVSVMIYDMTGSVVSNNTADVAAGANSITLDVQNLASGAYTTVIVAGGKNYTKNLIVSKN